MTGHGAPKRPDSFAAMRRHYRDTKRDHRPVPVIVPLLVVTALALWAYALLDPFVASMAHSWPAVLRIPARAVTDFAKSGWILYWSAAIILAGAAVYHLSTHKTRRHVAAQAIQIASYIFISVAMSGLIANLVKRAIGRPRPEMFDDHGVFSVNPFMHDSDFESFPSGHATTAGALSMALALLFPSQRRTFLIIGFVIALARIFVAAHYPSDVVVGFGWGMWFAFFMAVIFARHGIVFSHKDGKLSRLI